jgi:glycosyltransferase involved in cell wall biosynthesis
MEVVQVCPRYYPYIGGVETHVKNICERLVNQYDVSVFTTDSSGRLPRKETINGVKVFRFKCLAPGNAYYFSLEMLEKLQKVKSDIVHGHCYHALPLFFSKMIQKKKFIVTPHYHSFAQTGFRDFLIKLYKPIGGKVFEEANNIICVSNYEKHLLVNDFKLDYSKIILLPNGINKKEFLNLKKKKSKSRKILYVGRLKKLKGIDFLIKALPKIDDDIVLDIVGKGIYEKSLISLVKNLGLEKRVTFKGNLSRDDLLQNYANADLFVLLSKYEAFGICVAEALASKTACIVAKNSALKEWVDNVNCYGIEYPINIDRLSTLIRNVIGKDVTGVNLLDWNDIVSELTTIYQNS